MIIPSAVVIGDFIIDTINAEFALRGPLVEVNFRNILTLATVQLEGNFRNSSQLFTLFNNSSLPHETLDN